jgi:Predicted phosphosugar isomerases
MGAKTIIISNNLNSPIIKTSNYFFDINAGEEKSVAATKTFVLSLLIILKLVFSTLNKKDINKNIEKLSNQLILDNQNQWNPNILDKTISNGYIISRGVGYAISNEISLKFKELCQEMIEPFSSAEVMHGPKSLIENSFKLFTVSLRDKSGMIVAKDSSQIISLTNCHYEITHDENSNSKLRYNTNEIIELDPIIVLSKFYPWIINYSFEKGLDPDNPRYLTKVTQTF